MRGITEVVSEWQILVDRLSKAGIIGFFTEEKLTEVIKADHLFGLAEYLVESCLVLKLLEDQKLAKVLLCEKRN